MAVRPVSLFDMKRSPRLRAIACDAEFGLLPLTYDDVEVSLPSVPLRDRMWCRLAGMPSTCFHVLSVKLHDLFPKRLFTNA